MFKKMFLMVFKSFFVQVLFYLDRVIAGKAGGAEVLRAIKG
jgi:hypothetical protein